MTKRMTIMLVLVVVIFGAVFGWHALRQHMINKAVAKFEQAAVTISTAKVTRQDWHPSIASIGSLEAVNGVDVSTEVSGKVTGITFHSGDFVKKDQLLVQIDDGTEQADLKNYQAQYQLAKITYQRDLTLLKTRAVSQSDVDSAKASLQEAEANVEKTQVEIHQKHITAPFAGKLGIRQINLGEYVSAGTTFVSLEALDPLFVNFNLPQQDLERVSIGQTVHVTTDTYPKTFFVGKVTAIDSEINEDTRTFEVQATLQNPQLKLYPGMFVRTQLQLPTLKSVVTVPTTAVDFTLYGDAVFVVKRNGKKDSHGFPTGTVQRIFVKTGDKKDNRTVITKGLSGGEEIVDSGQLKLNNGSAIAINNQVNLPQIKATE